MTAPPLPDPLTPPTDDALASSRHRSAASKSRLRHDKAIVMNRSKDSVYAPARGVEMLWLLDHVLACARALEVARAAALEAGGLDGPTRRLLAVLHDGGPQPVPGLAHALNVTRQAVQPLVNASIAAGHVELLPNRAKRRSPLVRLTEAGFRIIADLNATELAAATSLGHRFLASHVMVTRRTLANLIFATTGTRAAEVPALRASYTAVYARAGSEEALLNRHPLMGASLAV